MRDAQSRKSGLLSMCGNRPHSTLQWFILTAHLDSRLSSQWRNVLEEWLSGYTFHSVRHPANQAHASFWVTSHVGWWVEPSYQIEANCNYLVSRSCYQLSEVFSINSLLSFTNKFPSLKFLLVTQSLKTCTTLHVHIHSVIFVPNECSLWRPRAQPCPVLCDLVDYNLPGSSTHEISQESILEWAAIFSSRDLWRL